MTSEDSDRPEVALEDAGVQSTATGPRRGASAAAFPAAIYTAAFVTGAIVMSFEMLGSRYLNPYFGSGIYTWAALISTVLTALTAGYFLGGFIADRTVSAAVLGTIVAVASLYLLALPSFAEAILGFVSDHTDNIRLGSLYSALAIMFVPVTLLGVYSPFAIRLVLRTAQRSGTVSGAVYGVSTAGSIAGTLGTTFFLIPLIGTRAITLTLGAAGIACGLCLTALGRVRSPRKAAKLAAVLIAVAVLGLASGRASPQRLVDESMRARMLEHADGRIAHIESEYNDVFVDKRGPLLALTTRVRNETFFHSIVDLGDPDDMPVPYTRLMSAALLYPQNLRHILMVGLGAGSISTYLGRAMPDARIDVVELDPGVIAAGRKYFGLQETDKVRFIESDGRVYLNRSKDRYDLIILDAFRELGVPFHLLTREFYTLLKERLAPGGAVASNVAASTKLYVSSLVTLRAVFPTVDTYSDWKEAEEAQSIAVATPSPRPSADALTQRAAALQEQHHFRYPPGVFVGRRVTDENADGGEVLTDDFAPVNLYETEPRPEKKAR
ncbi:MAG TPA: fused MFS/spermidine synthase [Xanthobacteraceae bacterium]|nr:fused MFS/spermidine synthase [Xanthobacteraceae bacterium]